MFNEFCNVNPFYNENFTNANYIESSASPEASPCHNKCIACFMHALFIEIEFIILTLLIK